MRKPNTWSFCKTHFQKVSLPQDWADYLNVRLEKDKVESAQSVSAFVEKNQKMITDITVKLQRLLDGYLDQDMDKEVYRAEKSKLLSEKKSLEEEISRNQQKQKHWLEPMSKWIKDAGNMEKIALDNNLLNKKVAAKEIFGSNLLLQNKTVRASAPNFENSLANSGETAWATLRVAHSFVNSKPESFIRERGSENLHAPLGKIDMQGVVA